MRVTIGLPITKFAEESPVVGTRALLFQRQQQRVPLNSNNGRHLVNKYFVAVEEAEEGYPMSVVYKEERYAKISDGARERNVARAARAGPRSLVAHLLCAPKLSGDFAGFLNWS